MSGDGKTIACHTLEYVDQAKTHVQHRVNIEGRRGKFYDSISGLSLSRDGQQIAYSAYSWLRQGSGGVRRVHHVVLNGKEIFSQAHRPGLENIPLAFSRDGMRLVYAFYDDTGCSILDGQHRGPAYAWIKALRLSPDGRSLAYLACTIERGQSPYGCLDRAGHRGPRPRWSVVVNGRESELYDQVDQESFRFTEDSQHIVYGARKDRELWWIAHPISTPVQ